MCSGMPSQSTSCKIAWTTISCRAGTSGARRKYIACESFPPLWFKTNKNPAAMRRRISAASALPGASTKAELLHLPPLFFQTVRPDAPPLNQGFRGREVDLAGGRVPDVFFDRFNRSRRGSDRRQPPGRSRARSDFLGCCYSARKR